MEQGQYFVGRLLQFTSSEKKVSRAGKEYDQPAQCHIWTGGSDVHSVNLENGDDYSSWVNKDVVAKVTQTITIFNQRPQVKNYAQYIELLGVDNVLSQDKTKQEQKSGGIVK